MGGDVLKSCCGSGLPVAQLVCGVSVGVTACLSGSRRASRFLLRHNNVYSASGFNLTTPPLHQNQKAWLFQTTNYTGTRFLCQPVPRSAGQRMLAFVARSVAIAQPADKISERLTKTVTPGDFLSDSNQQILTKRAESFPETGLSGARIGWPVNC